MTTIWLVVSNIFYFHPDPWGYDPIWRAYFSDGLKPPTSYSNLFPWFDVFLFPWFVDHKIHDLGDQKPTKLTGPMVVGVWGTPRRGRNLKANDDFCCWCEKKCVFFRLAKHPMLKLSGGFKWSPCSPFFEGNDLPFDMIWQDFDKHIFQLGGSTNLVKIYMLYKESGQNMSDQAP